MENFPYLSVNVDWLAMDTVADCRVSKPLLTFPVSVLDCANKGLSANRINIITKAILCDNFILIADKVQVADEAFNILPTSYLYNLPIGNSCFAI